MDPEKPPSDPKSNSKTPLSFEEHLNAVFHSVLGLPSTIYNRGNEHGREFNRMYREGKERDEVCPREREQRCVGSSVDGRWKWSMSTKEGAIAETRSNPINEKDDSFHKDVEKDERGTPAVDEDIAAMFRRQYNGHGRVSSEEAEELGRVEERWSEEFKRWSSDNDSRKSKARNMDDPIDKTFENLERWLGGAEKWTRQLQRDYQNESRLWEKQGLFGPDIPFSGPLSTMLSLGMRPFLPQDSAIDYLLRNEYSPLHLEHEEGFDASWRLRFEDLLKAQAGTPMAGRDEREHGTALTGVEWLGQRIIPLLQERKDRRCGRVNITIASTPNQHSVVQVTEPPSPTEPTPQAEEAGTGPETEMEQYERYFGGSQRPIVEQQVPLSTDKGITHVHVGPNHDGKWEYVKQYWTGQLHQEPTEADPDPTKGRELVVKSLGDDIRPTVEPSTPIKAVKESDIADITKLNILSTLTTTVRHVAPDGSVVTKKVLKKRFADGSEESSETVETAHGSGLSWDQTRAPHGEEDLSQNKSKPSRGKGWFWTN
jgi:hypothetical protein